MSFTEEEVRGFKVEAEDLIDIAEKSLLSLDKGDGLSGHYDSIFRAFHSIKGAAGMMDLPVLQNHMHQLETIFTEQKVKATLEKPLIDFFLRGLDATRTLLNDGINREVPFNFDYTIRTENPIIERKPTPTPTPIKQKISPGKILIIDDEPEIVEMLTQLLTAENFIVKGFTSPIAAMDEIANFDPDVLFTDISMPDMTGLDILKATAKAYPDLPVVFISGYVDKSILLQAIHHGVFGVIEKPFDILRVVECSLNAIEKHRLGKMLNSSINLLMYQFSDLSDFLKSTGREDVHKVISGELTTLIEQRRQLRKKRKPEAA